MFPLQKILWWSMQLAMQLPTLLHNQDPLENFFGSVHSDGARNVNLTSSSFTASFKALIINNLLHSQAPQTNCVETLSTLRTLLTDTVIEDITPHTGITIEMVQPEQTYSATHAYIARKILKCVKCKECHENLISRCNISQHWIIQVKDYRKNLLTYPTTNFSLLINRMWQCLKRSVDNICFEEHIQKS